MKILTKRARKWQGTEKHILSSDRRALRARAAHAKAKRARLAAQLAKTRDVTKFIKPTVKQTRIALESIRWQGLQAQLEREQTERSQNPRIPRWLRD